MCRYISFFHHPQTHDILVSDLHSHGKTERNLGLSPIGPYREGHYLPDGAIECRLAPSDESGGLTAIGCAAVVRNKWPTFAEFEKWACATVGRRPRKPRPNVFTEWIKQTRTAYKKGNVSFDGPTIQSYGWWPMARLVGKRYCLYRDSSYSHTTAKHQSGVRRAVIAAKRVMVLTLFPDFTPHGVTANRKWYKTEIAAAKGKLARARTDWRKRQYQERIDALVLSRRIYNRLTRTA